MGNMVIMGKGGDLGCLPRRHTYAYAAFEGNLAIVNLVNVIALLRLIIAGASIGIRICSGRGVCVESSE